MTDRKFYETTITVKVLSEQPLRWNDLNDLAYAIEEGDCVGHIPDDTSRTLTGKECADLLDEFGSESGFFQLDDEGNDLEGA